MESTDSLAASLAISIMENDDDDDFFGDQEEDQRTEKESAAEADRLKIAGYHDTFEVSHDAALQDGFNAGYLDSYDTAVSIGRLLGRQVAQDKLKDHSKVADPPNFRMASVIRSRLSQLSQEKSATCVISMQMLESLYTDVQKIAAVDSTGRPQLSLTADKEDHKKQETRSLD